MTDRDNASIPAAQVLLAGPDTIHLSLDLEISDEMRAKFETEKATAQEAGKINAVHCPDWLGAQILPHGARGGYGLLLETENFSVKILGAGIPNRPGLFLELRSHFLHTHPAGPAGACEEVLAWIREHLLADRDPVYVETWASFKAARLSRVDLHIDWQGWLDAVSPRWGYLLSAPLYQASPSQMASLHRWHNLHRLCLRFGLSAGSHLQQEPSSYA